jgi:hypothetical protein
VFTTAKNILSISSIIFLWCALRAENSQQIPSLNDHFTTIITALKDPTSANRTDLIRAAHTLDELNTKMHIAHADIMEAFCTYLAATINSVSITESQLIDDLIAHHGIPHSRDLVRCFFTATIALNASALIQKSPQPTPQEIETTGTEIQKTFQMLAQHISPPSLTLPQQPSESFIRRHWKALAFITTATIIIVTLIYLQQRVVTLEKIISFCMQSQAMLQQQFAQQDSQLGTLNREMPNLRRDSIAHSQERVLLRTILQTLKTFLQAKFPNDNLDLIFMDQENHMAQAPEPQPRQPHEAQSHV